MVDHAPRRLCRPSHDNTNAYYAAEVQSGLRAEIRSHVLGKPGGNNNRVAFPPDIEFLAANSPLIERDAISLAFFVG
jgi:hypothetical protein